MRPSGAPTAAGTATGGGGQAQGQGQAPPPLPVRPPAITTGPALEQAAPAAAATPGTATATATSAQGSAIPLVSQVTYGGDRGNAARGRTADPVRGRRAVRLQFQTWWYYFAGDGSSTATSAAHPPQPTGSAVSGTADDGRAGMATPQTDRAKSPFGGLTPLDEFPGAMDACPFRYGHGPEETNAGRTERERERLTGADSAVGPSLRAPRAPRVVMLAYWDNIVGPKIEQVRGYWPLRPNRTVAATNHRRASACVHQCWSRTAKALDEELLLYVARHTLNGEIVRPFTDEIEPKFYVLGDQGPSAPACV